MNNSVSRPETEKTSVLLVEDEPDIGKALKNFLEAQDYAVKLATTGEEAFRSVKEFMPDILVLDVQLPDSTGYEILDTLRKQNFHQPVIFLTGLGDEEHKLKGFEVGADDYMTKPFNLKELDARIKALLRRISKSIREITDEDLKNKFGLTPRQVAVAHLVGSGCTNAQIAEKLSISYFTVKNHTEQILSKLNVTSRSAVGKLLYKQ